MRLLGYLFAVPNTMIGLALCRWYAPASWHWADGCLEVVATRTLVGGRWVAAQTFGWFIVYRDVDAWTNASLRVHERVHVRHALWMGPLFLLAYVGHWLYLLARLRDWRKAYRQVWSERIAYRVQREYADGQRPGEWGSESPV